MTTTGQQIRAARERAGLTQEQLASYVGVTLRTIGNWERGASVPRNRLAKVHEVLPELSDQDDRGVDLRSASDAEVLAEIARRFARREDEEHVRSAAITQAGVSPATTPRVSSEAGERVELPPAAAAGPGPPQRPRGRDRRE